MSAKAANPIEIQMTIFSLKAFKLFSMGLLVLNIIPNH